eukprot:8372803-Alexandrium_andersonii.AAC.1
MLWARALRQIHAAVQRRLRPQCDARLVVDGRGLRGGSPPLPTGRAGHSGTTASPTFPQDPPG